MIQATPAGAEATPKKRSKFKQSFWVANTMEIFERLAWYGFFAVSTLYITGSTSEGALGFSSEQRGMLQGIVPFVLYLLPVVFGALGDRFGYKKTFMIAYATLVPAYFLLGQFTTFGGFFIAFLFVAVGAAIFKPVVVGTVARTTDETNSSMGFGIFYMMVNIGGFIGPIVAGYVRVRYGWNFVFIASSFWIACNFIWLFLFYKEPTTESQSAQKRSIKQVFTGLVDVLGNGRFFLMVFGILFMLMVAGRGLTWTAMGLITLGWLILNLLIDIPLRKREKAKTEGAWLSKPMKLGNWKFGLYLLILSGFWTSFNQIFLTMPEYIRDFVDTRDMVDFSEKVLGKKFSEGLAAVNEELLAGEIGRFAIEEGMAVEDRLQVIESGRFSLPLDSAGNRLPMPPPRTGITLSEEETDVFRWELFDFKVRVPEEVLMQRIADLKLRPVMLDSASAAEWQRELSTASPEEATGVVRGKLTAFADAGSQDTLIKAENFITEENLAEAVQLLHGKARSLTPDQFAYAASGLVYIQPADLRTEAAELAESYRQVNPEYIINVDAGAIVVFQVLVSYLIGFFPPLSVMVLGIIVSAVGIGMSAWLFSGWTIVLAITIFAFGEMMASPKSQEYVGRIAPQDKVAMYMGYYFWTVALGNIFGGRLSGELYGHFARDLRQPDIMWVIFGGLGLITAVALILYDKLVLRKGEMR